MPMVRDDLVMPFVHLNGTSLERLGDGLIEAVQALEVAAKKVGEAVHPRDYYPHGDDKARLAMQQQADRIQSVLRAQRELQAMYDHITKLPWEKPAA